MREGGADRPPPSACSQQSNQSSPDAYPGQESGGGRVLSQDIPHIPSLLLRPKCRKPCLRVTSLS